MMLLIEQIKFQQKKMPQRDICINNIKAAERKKNRKE